MREREREMMEVPNPKQPLAMTVQSLAESGISQVPSEYIQPCDIRPTSLNASGIADNKKSVPLIDLSGSGDGGGVDQVREEVGRACREWGAFHVSNHGVPVRLLDDMRRVGRSFFEDCSMDHKLSYSCNPNSPASEGYGSRLVVASNDAVLDWRDFFDHHTFPLSRRNPSRWSHSPPNYREIVAEYSDHMKALTQKLLSLVSDSLDLPSSFIEEAIGEFYQNITVSYYPPCPQPDLTLGFQAHSDYGALTLLIQDDVGGLQLLKDGDWINVLPVSDAILVILADQTEIITNGGYRSAQHRAITNVNKARLSVATFHDPANTMVISPAFQLVSESSPLSYQPVTYGEYVSSWYTKGPEGKRNIDALLL